MKKFLLYTLLIIYPLFLSAQDETNILKDFSRIANNYPATLWNPVIGSSEIHIANSDSGSVMDNFVSDAMRNRTEADLAILNSGDVCGHIFIGDITELDMVYLCPLGRKLVIAEVNGEFLQKLIETTISGVRQGAILSGGRVEYDTKRPSKNRLTFFQIGEHPLYPRKDYRIVTTDYLIGGHAGFYLFAEIDSTKIFHTGILLREVVAEYIRQITPLNKTNTGYIERMIRKE